MTAAQNDFARAYECVYFRELGKSIIYRCCGNWRGTIRCPVIDSDILVVYILVVQFLVVLVPVRLQPRPSRAYAMVSLTIVS